MVSRCAAASVDERAAQRRASRPRGPAPAVAAASGTSSCRCRCGCGRCAAVRRRRPARAGEQRLDVEEQVFAACRRTPTACTSASRCRSSADRSARASALRAMPRLGEHHQMRVVDRHQRRQKQRLGVFEVLVENEADVLGGKRHRRPDESSSASGPTPGRRRAPGLPAIANSRASAASIADDTAPRSCASSPSAEISIAGTFGTIRADDAPDRLERAVPPGSDRRRTPRAPGRARRRCWRRAAKKRRELVDDRGRLGVARARRVDDQAHGGLTVRARSLEQRARCDHSGIDAAEMRLSR